MKIIPLTTNPNQTMTVTVPVDNKNITVKLNIKYNSIAGYWEMTVCDYKTGKIILDNVPLLTGGAGAADILKPYQYLGLGSAIVVNRGSSNDNPGENDLGTDYLLLWGDTIT